MPHLQYKSHRKLLLSGYTLLVEITHKNLQFKDSMVYLQLENEKVRSIPHSIVAPLAVSGMFFLQ